MQNITGDYPVLPWGACLWHLGSHRAFFTGFGFVPRVGGSTGVHQSSHSAAASYRSIASGTAVTEKAKSSAGFSRTVDS